VPCLIVLGQKIKDGAEKGKDLCSSNSKNWVPRNNKRLRMLQISESHCNMDLKTNPNSGYMSSHSCSAMFLDIKRGGNGK